MATSTHTANAWGRGASAGSGARVGCSSLQLRAHRLAELLGVLVELADALGQLQRGHLVLVQHPPELLFGQLHLGVLGRCAGGTQLGLDIAVVLLELLQQHRADGERVAARQLKNLLLGAEGRPHDDCLVAVHLVVVVDALHREDAWVFFDLETRNALLLLVKIGDATSKWGDECGTNFCSNSSLAKVEEEGQIAVVALALELLGGLQAFPSGCDLKKKTLLHINSFFLIKADQPSGTVQGTLSVK
mmetsp:Transcript_49766/g.125090  ORF Transcript_49766/g.125090 Transcript_49766/m.125090 type:complete len:246 (-) Transcript_49766:349-1086(-)